MATTYLTLTNRVLRELNETELTSSTPLLEENVLEVNSVSLSSLRTLFVSVR